MSRHSRTSATSPVLKHCFDPGREVTEDDLRVLREHIMKSSQIPDEEKNRVIDLATVMVLHHDLYRKAYRRLEEHLRSIGIEPEQI